MRKHNRLAALKVLVMQENPEYTDLVRDRLNQEPTVTFNVKGVSSLAEGLERIREQAPDIILLELSLEDSQGLATFRDLQRTIPKVPIVILTSMDNEMLALQAVRLGAQDYILKGEAEGQLLPRVIHNAVERQRQWAELQDMTLTDELTGLYNRRGFLVLAEQQLKLAKRNKKDLLLFLVDVDNFKQINDKHGHSQGDVALTQIAQILTESFRKSDIVTRIGGDEFAIIAIEASNAHIPLLLNRIHDNLRRCNADRQHSYELSLSMGVSTYDFKKTVFVEQLLAQADKELYRNKRLRKKVRQTS